MDAIIPLRTRAGIIGQLFITGNRLRRQLQLLQQPGNQMRARGQLGLGRGRIIEISG
jgi:hypothetical protein